MFAEIHSGKPTWGSDNPRYGRPKSSSNSHLSADVLEKSNQGTEHRAGYQEMYVPGIFLKPTPNPPSFLHKLGVKLLVVTQKCTFCRTACLRKKWEKSSRRKKLDLRRADGGGSSLVSHNTEFQTGSAAMCSPSTGTTGKYSCCASVWWEREKGFFFFFFNVFSDSWGMRSHKMDALNWSLCLAQATAEVGTAGDGLQGTLCLAAALCFPLELFQDAWLYSWGTVGKTRSQEVIKSHYYYLSLVNICAMVMSGGVSQVPAVSPSLVV